MLVGVMEIVGIMDGMLGIQVLTTDIHIIATIGEIISMELMVIEVTETVTEMDLEMVIILD
jgi:hypothetical protein